MHPNSTMLAALALCFAPVVCQAADHGATPAAPASVLSIKQLALPLPTPGFKADDYKEADLWGRIRTGYAIPDINNALVTKHVNWYASRPDYIARTSARASRYLFHVV